MSRLEVPCNCSFKIAETLSNIKGGLDACDKACFSGPAVLSLHGLCPPFEACPNDNIFQHFFGIKFYFENHTHVRGIFQFKYARCFGFVDDLTYCLSKLANKFCLNATVPARISAWLFDRIFDCMILIHDMNCKIMGPRQYAALAATIQSFVSDTIGSRLPSHERWVNA
jgi:hypothetical protein